MLNLIGLALAAAMPVQSPELLPDLLEGWRFERIDLPLEFAPDLGYEGFEELAFAPGMFEPGSETYFSYAFAMRLDGDVRLGAAELEDLLEGYFRGLCSAVAEGRGLKIDVDQIDAEVRRVEGDFHATCKIFDAFTTGAAVDLQLEISVTPAPRATLLFAAVSPFPNGGGAWASLRRIRSAWDAARPLPVFFNHLFVAPDAETYEAIRDSKFLREVFAVGEERTTVRRDMTYTGLYFYGTRTYFEFLKPEAAAPFPEGGCGLALGIEDVGGTARCAASLKAAGIETFAMPVTRTLDDKDIPWFQLMGISLPVSSPSVFTMEYEPAFLAKWHPPAGDTPSEALSKPKPGIRRDDVLARYRQVIGGPGAPLFEDVTEVYLEASASVRASLVSACTALGHEIDEGDATVIHAPQARFVLRDGAGPARITGFRMRLREPVEREPIRFSSARLEFQGSTATFWF